MSNLSGLSSDLEEYLIAVSVNEADVLRRLRQETASQPHAMMQISPDVGSLLQFLVHAVGARRTLEVGVFTGYSSLAVALALPADGRLVACDVSEEYTSIARRYWQEAGVAAKIDLRLAPALQTLDSLLANGEEGKYDFAFIDADKGNYANYFDRALRLLRPGGVIAVDNVLWSGRVADPSVDDEDTVAIRDFNRKLHTDPRVFITMLPVRDGVTLAWKR